MHVSSSLCGEREESLDGADADARADQERDGVDGDDDGLDMGPSPCGADRPDEHGERGQEDERQPLEHVVRAARYEPRRGGRRRILGFALRRGRG